MNHALRHLARLLPLFLLCVALAACGGDKTSSDGGESADTDEHGHEHKAPHGGVLVESSDHAMHFEIAHDDGAGLVKLWIYDGDIKPITTDQIPVINIPGDEPVQVKGACPGGAKSSTEWHFSHEALKGHVHGARLRVLAMDRSYMVDMPDDRDGHDDHDGHEDHDGHGHDEDGDDHGEKHGDHDGHEHDKDGDEHKGHEHDAHDEGDEGHVEHDHDHAHEGEGPHHGMVRGFLGSDGHVAGYIELKLHDDKGDLELWIATDKSITKPLDLTLESQVTVTFTSMKDKKVTLQVRNKDKNEDEDGVANNREGNTNYFIFPGDTGADAKWLQGKAFKATVTVTFSTTQGDYTTKPFELAPHTH